MESLIQLAAAAMLLGAALYNDPSMRSRINRIFGILSSGDDTDRDPSDQRTSKPLRATTMLTRSLFSY